MRLTLICVVALALGACATLPSAPPGPLALGQGAWRVTGAAPDAAQARLAALRAAADLTLSHGGDWFRVVEREGAGAGGHGGVGLMDDLSTASLGRGSRRTLDIEVGRGGRPSAAEVYDAREVAAHLPGGPPPPPSRPAGVRA